MWWIAAALAEEPAEAGPPWQDRWYARPRLNARVVAVNGVPFVQGVGGAEAGLVRRWDPNPHWVSQTRAVAVGIYGLSTGSLGGDVRLGSFVGPDLKPVRLAIGPDFWFNGYGAPDALDYWLPWSPGIDVPASAFWKLAPSLLLDTSVIPGWAFDPDRQNGGVGPFHELTALAALHLTLDGPTFVLGYQRTWNGAGVFDGIILSFSLR